MLFADNKYLLLKRITVQRTWQDIRISGGEEVQLSSAPLGPEDMDPKGWRRHHCPLLPWEQRIWTQRAGKRLYLVVRRYPSPHSLGSRGYGLRGRGRGSTWW
jgi:hypothetical protein